MVGGISFFGHRELWTIPFFYWISGVCYRDFSRVLTLLCSDGSHIFSFGAENLLLLQTADVEKF